MNCYIVTLITIIQKEDSSSYYECVLIKLKNEESEQW